MQTRFLQRTSVCNLFNYTTKIIKQPRFPISEELRAKLEKFQIELARHLPSDKALENNMDINQLNEKLITSIKQQVRRSAKT